MRKLRVGVWTQDNITATLGGGSGYYSEIVDCISKFEFTNADICFIGEHNNEITSIGDYKYYAVNKIRVKKFLLLKLIGSVLLKMFKIDTISRVYYEKSHKEKLKQYQLLLNICDIIYYPLPLCKFPDFPFICTLWDLGHINTFAFPEVTSYGNFERKREHHEVTLMKALMVICESDAGKCEAIKYLKLNEDRIRILPLFPSRIISHNLIPSKPTGIGEDFIYIHYPAQYWAHKNHFNLIYAFKGVVEKYPHLKLILTGSDHGNKKYITDTIKELNLSERVIDLGFVSLSELKWIYIHSRGMIMPTLIGPTNMPPLEALALGCPVAVSDMPGHREQLGENAVYFNPLSTQDIESAIVSLINNQQERKIAAVPTVEASMKLLDTYFGELKAVRFMWR